MPSGQSYLDAYPRAGEVALLCEGDVIGYEASILRRWADDRLGTEPLVDIWPCGTCAAIYGVSDALGRSRPLIVAEDRDFRTPDEAVSDCNSLKTTREKRGIRILAWRAWRRNEIENYLLESEVILPVMAKAFRRSEQDIQEAISTIIPELVVYQAAQFALYRARRSWVTSDPSPVLPNNVQCRPIWRDSDLKAVAPDPKPVVETLKCNIQHWQARFGTNAASQKVVFGKNVVDDFERKYAEWQSVGWRDSAWRTEWSGKEVLQWLRIHLTARYGWYDVVSGQRVMLKWEALNRVQRDNQDRPIEAALRPMLVSEFVKHVTRLRQGEVRDEWAEIETALRSFKPTA